MNRNTAKRTKTQSGFTILEMMVSVAILTLVIGVVVDGLTQLQKRNRVETSKVDLTQEVRQFQDQIVSDIHQSGYPSILVFDPSVFVSPLSATDCTKDYFVSCGLVSVTPSAIQFEGDIDGSGTVSEVFIQLSPLNGPCPCTIQRGTETKTQYQNNQLPAYYTEVNNVMNTSVFTGYDNAGNTLTINGTPPANMNAVEITLNVKSSIPDTNGAYPTITMSTGVKVYNFITYGDGNIFNQQN